MSTDPRNCPLCGKPNECALVQQQSNTKDCNDANCWCMRVVIRRETLERVATEEQGRRCLCRRCASAEPDLDTP